MAGSEPFQRLVYHGADAACGLPDPRKFDVLLVARDGQQLAASDVDLQSLWPKLVEAIGRASPFARSYFIEAHPVSFTKNVLTIGFDPEFADHIGMVDNAKNHALIATKLAELGYPGAQVKIIKVERPGDFMAPAPAAEPATNMAALSLIGYSVFDPLRTNRWDAG